MAVIAAISAMQVAGGLDYLVNQTEKLLRKNPKYITILAPIVTYFLTIFAGTGNISLATLPVIAEVAKEQGIKPCRPLSTAVVSAQIAITASPISAAVVYMSSVMEGHGISYIHLLSVVIPSTLLAVLVMSFLVTMLFNSKLSDDPIYRKRLEEGLIELRGEKQIEIKPMAKNSVWLFLLGVICVVVYAIVNSPSLGLVEKPLMNTTNAILIIMLSVATLTTILCKVETDAILNSSTFKAGMSACICILGVAWLGDTFVSANIDWIKDTAGSVIQGHPWLLAVSTSFVPPCCTSTVTYRASASILPSKNVGLFTLVRLSPFVPLSSVLSSTIVGSDSRVSMMKSSCCVVLFPALSVASTVRVCLPSPTSASQV
ncbi:anaerobic C4-dicarboxylate transporter [Salmonella enterica subsp. enterica serovar Virchow str. ATCC 51955]|nr:anaerobic C4-dicarboxylate transporter [Salmonella enterica subsp. enterica serovar Virchow str. ATCC 51955]